METQYAYSIALYVGRLLRCDLDLFSALSIDAGEYANPWSHFRGLANENTRAAAASCAAAAGHLGLVGARMPSCATPFHRFSFLRHHKRYVPIEFGICAEGTIGLDTLGNSGTYHGLFWIAYASKSSFLLHAKRKAEHFQNHFCCVSLRTHLHTAVSSYRAASFSVQRHITTKHSSQV